MSKKITIKHKVGIDKNDSLIDYLETSKKREFSHKRMFFSEMGTKKKNHNAVCFGHVSVKFVLN